MKTILLFCFICCSQLLTSQVLQSGFDKKEYSEVLKVIRKAHQPRNDSMHNLNIRAEYLEIAKMSTFPEPEDYVFAYRSPKVAFDNGGDLWIHRNKAIAMLIVRGTIPTETSFLANAYAAMVPAIGELKLENDSIFKYKLANDSSAAIHVGYLVATLHLVKYFEHQIDSCYKIGIKDFIITGHSQGGALSYLITAYFRNLQKDKKFPADIQFKTYSSAAPKPGNLFFAYDYEVSTAGGWAFTVVNSADWVADVPFTIQTMNDLPNVNPFKERRNILQNESFRTRKMLNVIYNHLDRPTKMAQRKYQRYFGKAVSVAVKQKIKNFNAPEYYKSNYYVRVGVTVVLMPDEEYKEKFKNTDPRMAVWQHHMLQQYLFLTEKLP